MKRISVVTSKKMYMFTLFKDSMLIRVCVYLHSLQVIQTFYFKKKKKPEWPVEFWLSKHK